MLVEIFWNLKGQVARENRLVLGLQNG